MTSLTRALEELQDWLRGQEIPFMVIGGIANLIWGEPRLTQDIDITVEVPEGKINELVAKLSEVFKVLPESPLSFVKAVRVIPIEVEGVRADLILAGTKYEREAIERVIDMSFGGVKVRICTPEDLIIHKAISERERDWEDIEGILLRKGNDLDKTYLMGWLHQFAQVIERPDIPKRFESMWTELVEEE